MRRLLWARMVDSRHGVSILHSGSAEGQWMRDYSAFARLAGEQIETCSLNRKHRFKKILVGAYEPRAGWLGQAGGVGVVRWSGSVSCCDAMDAAAPKPGPALFRASSNQVGATQSSRIATNGERSSSSRIQTSVSTQSQSDPVLQARPLHTARPPAPGLPQRHCCRVRAQESRDYTGISTVRDKREWPGA